MVGDVVQIIDKCEQGSCLWVVCLMMHDKTEMENCWDRAATTTLWLEPSDNESYFFFFLQKPTGGNISNLPTQTETVCK